MSQCLLEINNVKKTYPIRTKNSLLFAPKQKLCALDHLSLKIYKGETYGLVGESGCGKSTIGRSILGLVKPDSGEILYNGVDLCQLSEKQFRSLRSELQMVFQNSLSALNPRSRIGDTLEEILTVHGVSDPEKRREKVLAVLHTVGLSDEHYFRFPHELSGGQVQRLGIACAIIIHPSLIVCDEPVSALDVSIQAQILNLLVSLKKDYELSLLFISHDISVVRFISDRIGVMYLGTLVEEAETEELFSSPLHPYTQALFSSIPDVHAKNQDFRPLNGEQITRTEEFAGCPFYNRCPHADDQCRTSTPTLKEVRPGHKAACLKI